MFLWNIIEDLRKTNKIHTFDQEIVEELRSRARNVLTTQALANEATRIAEEPHEDLLGMEGMTTKLAYDLAAIGIVSMEDLAEQAIDDLMDIESMTEELAGEIIMTARAPWFEWLRRYECGDERTESWLIQRLNN